MASEADVRNAGPVTLRDVAQRAGVSMSTASRALSGASHVRETLVERVREAAVNLDYHPNLTARNLRTQRTMTLGCVFHRLDSPLALEALEGIEETSRERGYSLAFTTAAGDPATARLLIRRLLERRVDGIFIYRPAGVSESLALCRQQGVPALALFSLGEDVGDVPVVMHRPGNASATAVRRLYDLGHRSLAYLATTAEMHDLRATRLRAACEELDIAFRLLTVPDAPDEISTRASIAAMLELEDAPTGVFTRNRHLPGVLAALRDAGAVIPRDLSLVAYGDSPWLRAFTPPIATVSTPGRDLGRIAVATMIDALEGTTPPPVTYAESPVWIDRASVGAVRAGSADEGASTSRKRPGDL